MLTVPVIIAILIAVVAMLLLLQPQSLAHHSLQQRIMRNQFKSSKHKWEKSELKAFYFCYLCNRLTNGWFSDVLECKKCGIIIHKICRYLKYRKPDCKFLVAKNTGSQFYHQWRQCRHSSTSNCSICQQLCTGFQAYICLWCNRSRHSQCNGESHQCDFGPLREFILEPTEIKCESINFLPNAFRSLRKSRKKQSESERSEKEESDEKNAERIAINCKPGKRIVIVLINKKSGGQAGNEFIKAFYHILNPLQVISILDEGLEKLKIFVDVPNLFLIVAGGDGTVCSVVNYVKTIWKGKNPPVAVLPLGTGNDLSRSLGWGGAVEDISASEILLDIASKGKNQLLDRWTMRASNNEEAREFTVYNYVGIGLDGKICKHFHQIREKYPQLFFSQFSNKLIYTQIGSADIFRNSKIPLAQLLRLFIDGKEICIDEYENIIILNIHHWGGGVELWKESEHPLQGESFFNDGKIEVIGLTDIVHMGQVQVGMDKAFSVGQGQLVEITCKNSESVIPLQIDGEPVQLVNPVRITFQRKDQADVLTVNSKQDDFMPILQKAVKEGIISAEQFQRINRLQI